jgi:adenosylhomocysteine nucleosidase
MDPGTGEPVWCSDVTASKLAVIVALEFEAAILRRAAADAGAMILVSGPGPGNARAASRRAIDAGAGALISIGLAGGLSQSAITGAVVLPHEVIGTDVRWPVNARWRQRLAAALDGSCTVLDAPLYSAAAVVTTPAAKSALAAATGAAAVDMESAAVVAAAAEAGLPCVVLRVVADQAGDALPARIDELVTVTGRTRWQGLVRMLFAPTQLAALVRLALRSRAAGQSLRDAVHRIAGATS